MHHFLQSMVIICWRCILLIIRGFSDYIFLTIVIIAIPVRFNCSAVFWRECSLRALMANAADIIARVEPTPIIRYCADKTVINKIWSPGDPKGIRGSVRRNNIDIFSCNLFYYHFITMRWKRKRIYSYWWIVGYLVQMI